MSTRSSNRPNSVNTKRPNSNTGGRNGSAGANANPPRKVVGQYMIGKTIGEGTFGKVKIAIHLPTGEKVAVKILEKCRIKEQADVRRVNREIKILKKAQHDNVIRLYEVLDTSNAVYLIMENCDGGEMFDYIVSHRHVQEKQACLFFHQIIDGLESLHNSEITHRDLKPENLLLKHSPGGWIVKIVDFGLSNTHDGGRLLSTACGSPCYAAPEMIAGKNYEGPMADLWSCGVILFALVCGHLPFEDPNTSALYQKILSGKYTPAKWLSNEVKDLIRKILEVNPNRRYKISDIRKHVWYKALPEDQVPKDRVSQEETDQARAEIFNAMSEANVDLQLVKDGISSKLCNSYTAMYYLLEQKAKNALFKQKQQQSLLKGGSNTKTQTAVATPAVAVTTSVDTVEYSKEAAPSRGNADAKSPNIPNAGPTKPAATDNKAPHPPSRPTPPVPSTTNAKAAAPLVPKLRLPAASTTNTDSNQRQKLTSVTARTPNNGSTHAIPGPNSARTAPTTTNVHGIDIKVVKPTGPTDAKVPTRPAPSVSKTIAGVNGMQAIISNDIAKMNIGAPSTKPDHSTVVPVASAKPDPTNVVPVASTKPAPRNIVPVPSPKNAPSIKSPAPNGSTSFANAETSAPPATQPVAVAPSQAPVQRSSVGGGRKGKNLVAGDDNVTVASSRPIQPASSAISTTAALPTPREYAAMNKLKASSNIKSLIG